MRCVCMRAGEEWNEMSVEGMQHSHSLRIPFDLLFLVAARGTSRDGRGLLWGLTDRSLLAPLYGLEMLGPGRGCA